jgi:hypothetical protein
MKAIKAESGLPNGKPILCIDFDGVLHSYKSGWQGPTTISDPPVEGAISWLADLVRDGYFSIAIYSSRSRYEGGIAAMKKWLFDNGFYAIGLLTFPTEKPPAFLQIDDRAICFEGTFPSIEEMKVFKPWNKRVEIREVKGGK